MRFSGFTRAYVVRGFTGVLNGFMGVKVALFWP